MGHCNSAAYNAAIGLKRRPLQACFMALLASPCKAFIPTPTLALARLSASIYSAAAPQHDTTGETLHNIRRSRLRRIGSGRPALAAPGLAGRQHRALGVATVAAATSASGSDDGNSGDAPGVGIEDVKSVALAAIEAAESALDREMADQASEGDADVQSAVAAARAAARVAVDSLRRGRGSWFEETGVDVAQDASAVRQAVISPARAAVKAAQAAVAREGKASPSSPSAAEARKAIDMVQAALGRRDEAAANLALPVAKSPSATGEKVARGVDVNHFSAVEATATGGELPVGRDLAEVAGAGNGGYAFDEEPTREPESALRTRNNPAASHSPLAHLLWRQVARPGDTVVDFTAGNGFDSLELAKIVALEDGVGRLFCVDVQEPAIEATRQKLQSELGEGAINRTTFKKGNFREIPEGLGPMSVQLVVYNLGWLPGGDKSITTELEDTLKSIENSKRLVKSGGMISVMCYSGHAEGLRETEALLEYARGLTHYHWRVFVHERSNRPGAPILITIYRL